MEKDPSLFGDRTDATGFDRAWSASPWPGLLLATLLAGTLGAANATGGREPETATRLAFGQSLEGALPGPGATARYRCSLTAGEFLAATVDQTGIDVAVAVSGPDGKQIVVTDSRWHGPEPVFVLAEASGDHTLEVRGIQKRDRQGRFTLRADAPHAPTPDDRTRLHVQAVATQARTALAKQSPDAFKEAQAGNEEAAPLWESLGDEVGLSQALNSLGHIYHRQQDVPKAREVYERALEIRRRTKDSIGEAECLHNLGALEASIGQRDKAAELYREALEIRRASGDELGQTQTLGNLGATAFRAGDHLTALGFYEEALPLLKGLDSRAVLIQTLIGLGAIHHRFGEWQQAVDYLEQNEQWLGPDQYLPGRAFNRLNLGAVLIELGEIERALAYLREVPALMRQIGNRSGEAAAWLNLGNAHLHANNGGEARICYERAAALVGEKEDPNVLVVALVNTARSLVDEGRTAEARPSIEQALEHATRLADRRWQGMARLHLGLADQADGQLEAAGNQMRQALTLAQEVQDVRGELNARYHLALLTRRQARWSEAADQLAAGVAIIESVRASLKAPQARLTYFALVQHYFEAYVDTLMQLHAESPDAGHDAAALEVSERARARILLERLREAGVEPVPSDAPDLALAERDLRRRQSIARDAVDVAGKPAASSRQAEIADLQAQSRRLEEQIRLRSPSFAALVQPPPLRIGDIQALLDDDTVLLEYRLGKERSFVWVVTPTGLHSYALEPGPVIEAAAQRVQALTTERNRRPAGESFALSQRRFEAADRELPAAAAELAKLIIQPCVGVLGGKRLVLVAEGALQAVPFGILPAPATGPPGTEPEPLILRHEIVLLPSASALKARREAEASARDPGRLLAIFADPVFDAADGRVGRRRQPPEPAETAGLERGAGARAQARDVLMRRLPFTRLEAEAIGRVAPRGTVRSALDFAASRRAALDPSLGSYAYIHFATHGVFDSSRPGQSGLVLSLVGPDGTAQEGHLYLGDIYNLRWPARLVTLSACESGAGKDFRGEGLLSLTRGFMYAGAERVVASGWKVDDEATTRLMTEFYRRLLGPRPERPAQALRHAQLAVRAERRFRAPYFWAAFSLHGEWR